MGHILEDFAIELVFEFESGEGARAVGDEVNVDFFVIRVGHFNSGLALFAIARIIVFVEFYETFWRGYVPKIGKIKAYA